MISIEDYNNEDKVQLCINEGCKYIFNFLLTISDNKKVLKISTSYDGKTSLN